MADEETRTTEVSGKNSGKYLLKSKKAEVRPKKRKRSETRVPEATKPVETPENKTTKDAETVPEAPLVEEQNRIPSDWTPRTRLGRLVADKQINSMEEALASNFPIRESEIVDIFLPELSDEVIDVNMVQRMTDSGRRVRFAVTCAVGNGDGYVGLGRAKGKEVGPTIQKAIDNAKLNIIRIRRACGSWECGCMRPHTIPFKVTGKASSAQVTLKPAPQGVQLVIGGIGKKIMKLAGIQDVWSFSRGQTRTTVNFAFAVFDALKETIRVRVQPSLKDELQITGGRT